MSSVGMRADSVGTGRYRGREVPADLLPTVALWSGGELRPVDEPAFGALLAADSWLVDEGRVRGYDAHWERFAGWCAELRVAREELGPFRAAVTASLPRTGRWFPRVDLAGGAAGRAGAAHLLLRLRPAQPLMSQARVLLAAPGDLRCHPRRKGPDLPLLLDLRAQAVAAGCDELAVRDAGGRLLEGALNSLLWWEDDVLCAAPDERTLPGITRALLLAIARERDVEVRRRLALPDELAGREAWLANAAHGICAVVAWEPRGPAAGPPERAASWRAALDATARHLDG
jgi:branched-subunit amino acid aminotransferase/4-amino-4-deoxychorismate lyase